MSTGSRLAGWMFAGPALLVIALFFAVPVRAALLLSLTDFDIYALADLHNLRLIKYGGQLHIDCHMTVPWYLNVHEAHAEIDALIALIKKEFGDAIEFFVHSDGCLDFSCPICRSIVHNDPLDRQY